MEPLVRLEREGEEPVVRQIVADAFGDERTPRLLDALRASTAWRGLSFVVETDQGPAGHLSLARGWLDAPSRLVEVLVMSPVSISPPFQGRGLGRLLVQVSLAQLAPRPEPLVFLEGNPKFYGRLGFLSATDLGFRSPSLRIPGPAFQCVKLPGYEPWMAGTLVYPDVFWDCDCVGLR